MVASVKPLKSNIRRLAEVSRDRFRGTDKAVWRFYDHGVTPSFVESWLNCREQTRLSYVEAWQPRDVPIYFEFGRCGHYVIYRAYGRKKPVTPKDVKIWVREYDKIWKAEVDAPTSKQLEQQELVYGMTEVVHPQYFRRWDGDLNGGKYAFRGNPVTPVKWTALEEQFSVPYKFPDGVVVPLRGMRDGVFLDKSSKMWVLDSKHLSHITDDDILDTMPFNFQLMYYLWATKEQTGKWPMGAVLNVIRRPGQRRGVDESLKDFLARIGGEYANPKKFDHNFIRFKLAIDRDEMQEWKDKTLDPIMASIRAWWDGREPHYATHSNLVTKYGRARMFLPIVKNEFSRCYRRDTPFPELEAA